MAPTHRANLVIFLPDINVRRGQVCEFSLECHGRFYELKDSFDTGEIHPNVFFKLIRRYFAERSPDSSIVHFDDVPITSMEDTRNISIEFDFDFVQPQQPPEDEAQPDEPEPDRLCFHYVIIDTDIEENEHGRHIIAEQRTHDIPQIVKPADIEWFEDQELNYSYEGDAEFRVEDFGLDEWDQFELERGMF